MPAKKRIAPEYTDTERFIRDFSILPTDADYTIATVWAMGTWTFSPAAPAMPHTYPYLYFTGAKGSGKSKLGLEVYSYICRNHRGVIDVTGPALFRMLGDFDEESGEIIPHYPTMACDEIDATYSGNKNEGLRGPLNGGYKVGSTVPRAMGKRSLEFPTYCPKVLIGIDNGHLPDTVTDRSIRIDLEKATPEQLDALREGPYSWEVADESAELTQRLADWAKKNAMVLREYSPKRPAGIAGRQWEVARSLVQIAHAIGNEREVIAALVEVLNREQAQRDTQSEVLTVIRRLFDRMPVEHSDRVTSAQMVTALDEAGIIPGTSQKGLRNLLVKWGLPPAEYIRMREGHPGTLNPDGTQRTSEDTGRAKLTARGYMRRHFDEAFALLTDDDDE